MSSRKGAGVAPCRWERLPKAQALSWQSCIPHRMEFNEQILRQNALLLTARERELVVLGNKHRRLLSWLALSNSLPDLFDRSRTPAEIASRFVSDVTSHIKIQRVRLLELLPTGMRCFGTEPCSLPPTPIAARELIARQRSGYMNEPETPEQEALASLMGLHRLLWHRLELPGGGCALFIGGFDKERSACYPPFDPDDAVQFAHVGQHFESLLRNVLLVQELEREKASLERFNEELDRRVRERTEDLVHANSEISQTLSALRQRDQLRHADLLQARAFQQGILPHLPAGGPLEFASVYRPVDLVGGDVYDVTQTPSGQYRLFIADATGHGVQASMRTIVLKLEYDRLKHRHESPQALMHELNRQLVESYEDGELLCTALCVDINVNDGGARASCVNAAHPPLFLRQGGQFVELSDAGTFLGLSTDVEYEVHEFDLGRGDLLMAYTDGVSEQRNAEGGVFDLREALREIPQEVTSPSEVLRTVCERLEGFCAGKPVGDDITMVAVRLG